MTNAGVPKPEFARKTINNLAQEAGIAIEFSKGKRKNDILVMTLSTEKNIALKFYLRVTEKFPECLVQIFRLKDPAKRGLVAALVEPLTEPIKDTDPFYQERRRNFFASKDTLNYWEGFLQEKD